jgi:hypothetical protein
MTTYALLELFELSVREAKAFIENYTTEVIFGSVFVVCIATLLVLFFWEGKGRYKVGKYMSNRDRKKIYLRDQLVDGLEDLIDKKLAAGLITSEEADAWRLRFAKSLFLPEMMPKKKGLGVPLLSKKEKLLLLKEQLETRLKARTQKKINGGEEKPAPIPGDKPPQLKQKSKKAGLAAILEGRSSTDAQQRRM